LLRPIRVESNGHPGTTDSTIVLTSASNNMKIELFRMD